MLLLLLRVLKKSRFEIDRDGVGGDLDDLLSRYPQSRPLPLGILWTPQATGLCDKTL
jgi:hypothetical protein